SLYSQLPETAETQLAKTISELQSEVRKMAAKYKQSSRKEASSCLYHQLPETLETQHAKEATELQSQKFYKEQYNREKGKSSYTNMKTLPEVEHAMEVNKKQSEVGYRKGKEQLHHYNTVPDRPDIVNATNAAKLASDVSFQTGQPGKNKHSLPSMHWVKYKENFDRQFKGQRPQYNPLDCLSFKHTQAAAALASQVEYKKKYEQTKAHYHIALDTAEQLHHKENAVLHSQVKYREEYEKNKGRSQMEFGDTQTYQVSKEAQKMQSEREYRRDYEEQVKGKALVDVEQTPGYLTARHASSLLSEKEYRKDLEQEVKGRGLSEPRPGPALTAAPCCLQREYRRDMEREVLGKGMELSADVLEIQRAKRASQIQKKTGTGGSQILRSGFTPHPQRGLQSGL
uniref:Nebulette n=1 Tax=Echeneis naucrates TaxID=173247 RepID=A0A665VJU1_ECHNA